MTPSVAIVLLLAAGYLAALGLEILRSRRPASRSPLGIAAGTLLLHTGYLLSRALGSDTSPLSSPYDWYLLAAWMLVAVYFYLVFYYPRGGVGLFILPLVLILIGASQLADVEPFAPVRASRFWGNVHGIFLLLGTVTVMVGFVAGLMYLVQSYRLKRKLPPTIGLRLPSLESLQRINSRAIFASVLFVGIGFFSGLVLNTIKGRQESGFLPWSDPVVVTSGSMLVWLLLTAIFALAYRAAREGRKVAYLTVASFIFLAISMFALLFGSSRHIPSQRAHLSGAGRGAAVARCWQWCAKQRVPLVKLNPDRPRRAWEERLAGPDAGRGDA